MAQSMDTKELKHRVRAKQKELEAKLEKMQADAAASGSEAKESVRRRLDELGEMMQEGWDDMREKTAQRLNEWLKKD